MNRPYIYRGQQVPGVFQRCNSACPAGKCTVHTWSFHLVLPAGPDGRRPQVTKGGFASGQEAKKAREDAATAARSGKVSSKPGLTFADWSEQWLAGKTALGKLRPSTARAHRDALRLHLVPQLGRYKLKDLTPAHLEKAYAAIVRDRQAQIERAARTGGTAPRPLSPSSVHRMHAIVASCLGSAEKNNLVPRNVARLVELPSGAEKKTACWTPEQGQQFLDWLGQRGDRLHPLIHLAIYTGLRRGELLALGWADVDLDGGTLRVWRQRTVVAGQVAVIEQPKTAAGDRLVPLAPETVAVLRQWRAQQNRDRLAWGPAWADGGWVFTHEDGKPLFPDTVGRVFRRLADQAGLPRLRFHDLRHTFASTGLDVGVQMAALSKVMGHTNPNFTAKQYGHLSAGQHRIVVEAIAKRLSSATG
ncbi:tyrosine-type recombinase/integrase [Micromonospora humi]|uniref:Site-specific recombinase XerD n=1 Tax=Micromonospora humi TaxID=745366 RepID=A0A1C5HL77_9ACTN|nr:site-specific integrase [Micromonospora humi]SCG46770.1 Site-specific recombinase XerD [Micromonospora humi]